MHWVRGIIGTDRVAGLLNKNLSESNHLFIVKLFGKVHELVCSILLITGTSSCEQGAESLNGKIAALYICTGRRILTEKIRKLLKDEKYSILRKLPPTLA